MSLDLRALITSDDPVILEIGCNDGMDTERFLELFPTAEIHCFEPEPRAIKQFKERINNPRCILHEFALADKDGDASFFQSSGTKKGAMKEDWDMSGSLNRPTGHLQYSPWIKFNTNITVPVKTLDSFFGNGTLPIDFIWMDVQGGEQNVIRGGRKVLDRTKFVYAEFSHWKKRLYEGQMTREETIKELGPDWEDLGVYEGNNILARNSKI